MSFYLRLLVLSVFFGVALLGCGDDEGAESSGDTSSLKQGQSQSVVSTEPDTLTPFEVLSVYQGSYDNTPAIQVNFTRPIKRDQNLEQLIQVNKEGDPQTGGWVISDDNRRLFFPYIQPQQVLNGEVGPHGAHVAVTA